MPHPRRSVAGSDPWNPTSSQWLPNLSAGDDAVVFRNNII
jgi:hypothetical protein